MVRLPPILPTQSNHPSAVCGITRHLLPCTHCHGTYHCSELCLDTDQAFHRPICQTYRNLGPKVTGQHLVFCFPTSGRQARPAWMTFGNSESILDNESLPRHAQMRALLGGEWQQRAYITQNRLAEEWLLNRELTVYGRTGSRNLPINQCLVATLAEGGHICEENEWRGPLVVVAAQRPLDPGEIRAGRMPRQPDASSVRAVIDDVTPWDYRQFLNFAVKPSGTGQEAIVWIPRLPGSKIVELAPEDAEFGEDDCREAHISEGYEQVGEPAGYAASEGSGVPIEGASPARTWVVRAGSPFEEDQE
ncbi:hypothetical protein QBC39DRAFT_99872 [Podospora conica]|nr:hypothetical protein QBC39DRAFT_99872 [Schizothecium conicum]